MNINQFIVIIIFCFLVFISLPLPTHSQGLVTCGLMSDQTGCTICDLIALIQRLYNKAHSYFALPIAALMLGYGGFLMVLSGLQGGKPSLYQKGIKVLTTTAIGILLIFCSWLLIDTLLKVIGAYQHANASSFGPWHQITCQAPQITFPKHLGCDKNDQCVLIDGIGTGNECTENSAKNNCGKDAEHLGCQDASCKWIKGPGANDCVEGQDPKCAHKGCDGLSCKFIPGSGPDECDTIGDNDQKCIHGSVTTTSEDNRENALQLEGVVTFTSAKPDCDGKSAATNFQELLNNRPLTACHATCKTDLKPCTGKTNAQPEMITDLVNLAYVSHLTFDVTSMATGKHRAGSDHYEGKAVDLSTAQNNYTTLETRLTELQQQGSPIRFIQCEDSSGNPVSCNSGNVVHLHVSYK